MKDPVKGKEKSGQTEERSKVVIKTKDPEKFTEQEKVIKAITPEKDIKLEVQNQKVITNDKNVNKLSEVISPQKVKLKTPEPEFQELYKEVIDSPEKSPVTPLLLNDIKLDALENNITPPLCSPAIIVKTESKIRNVCSFLSDIETTGNIFSMSSLGDLSPLRFNIRVY